MRRLILARSPLRDRMRSETGRNAGPGSKSATTDSARAPSDCRKGAMSKQIKPSGGLIHNSDRESQYASIKYTERLAEAGIEPSAGSVGDSGACLRAGAAGPGGQRTRRDGQRPLQGRGHPSARALALLRGGRVRNAGMGRLVQQSPAAGAQRQHPAGRSRGMLLRHARRVGHGGVTQTKRPPANPARFNSEVWNYVSRRPSIP